MEVESGAQSELGCGGEEWKGAEGDLESSQEFELLSRQSGEAAKCLQLMTSVSKCELEFENTGLIKMCEID